MLIFSRLPKLRRPQHHHRSIVDLAGVKCVRDRGLDHAVEKEKNLKPMLNLKDLLKSEPSKSLPISIIVDKKETLQLPIRPIDFVRTYPSVFEEFLPGGVGIHPHVRLTPEGLALDEEEQSIYQTQSYQKEAADRLLKLLMLGRINKIPLRILDQLKWDLGLPQNFAESLIPEFPDYFHVTGGHNNSPAKSDSNTLDLELVCWTSELAVSVMEKAAMKGESERTKGMPISFPLQFSRGFEMDKKYKKWVDEWQKLPYLSPYENSLHLPPNSDESDKWAVAVLHEFLHLLVPKKTERENILLFGEHLGIRSRFKRALLHHPGIFFVSSKNKTHAVVLREGYKRDLLVKNHPLMDIRYRYIHLMNMVKQEPKLKKQKVDNSKGEGKDEKESGEQQGSEFDRLSDSKDNDFINDVYDDEEEDESENGARISDCKGISVNSRRTNKKRNFGVKGHGTNSLGEDSVVNSGRPNTKRSFEAKRPFRKNGGINSVGRDPLNSKEKVQPNVSRRKDMDSSHEFGGKSAGRGGSDVRRSHGRISS